MSESIVTTAYENNNNHISLTQLFFIFLKIGSLAFGGYIALISVIENTIVKKMRLISQADMLDGISLANLLPGPMAVNVVAFIGYKTRGKIGAFISTTAVILPSFFLILALSYLYFNFGEVINLKSIFLGFIPAVSAVVLSVAWRLGKKTITGKIDTIIAIVALLVLFYVPLAYKVYAPILLIFISGIVGYIVFAKSNVAKNTTTYSISLHAKVILFFFIIALFILWFIPLPLDKNSILYLSLTFASMSLMLFGGGYVFIPIIGSIVVNENNWLTMQEFTDGIALGQITPGPILISATFIGYKVAGVLGALCSTIAIFFVPALLMIIVSHWFDSIRQSPTIKAIMHAIHCAVIGMICIAAFIIFKSSFATSDIFNIPANWPIFAIFVASLIGLIKFNLDVIWIIPPAGLMGYLLF